MSKQHDAPSLPCEYELLPYDECRADIVRLQSSLNDRRATVLKHYERRAYKTMKYTSWEMYVKRELMCSYRQSYRIIDAAIVERDLGFPEVIHIRANILLEMVCLKEPEDRRAAYAYAKVLAAKQWYPEGPAQMHKGKVTAKIMARAVRHVKGEQEPFVILDESAQEPKPYDMVTCRVPWSVFKTIQDKAVLITNPYLGGTTYEKEEELEPA